MPGIKLRAYDTLRKEYLSGGIVFIAIQPGQRPKEPVIYLDKIEDPDRFKTRFVIEQSFGIKDHSKERHEIYEGDILDIIEVTENKTLHYQSLVELIGNGLYVTDPSGAWIPLDCIADPERQVVPLWEAKVIGTIHD